MGRGGRSVRDGFAGVLVNWILNAAVRRRQSHQHPSGWRRRNTAALRFSLRRSWPASKACQGPIGLGAFSGHASKAAADAAERESE